MKNKFGIILSLSYVFLSMSLIFVLVNSITISGFAQTQIPTQTQEKPVANQPEISDDDYVVDHIFTTLRKDNALYDLQQNITLPAGKDMTYVDITADGKVVAATSSGDNQTFIFNGTNSKLIEKIEVGNIPKGVKISPDKNMYSLQMNYLDLLVS